MEANQSVGDRSPVEGAGVGSGEHSRSGGPPTKSVTCQGCHHETKVNVEAWPDQMGYPSFGPRLRCSLCGNLATDARPDDALYADPGWYQPPAGTVAQKASRQDLERDGIKL